MSLHGIAVHLGTCLDTQSHTMSILETVIHPNPVFGLWEDTQADPQITCEHYQKWGWGIGLEL